MTKFRLTFDKDKVAIWINELAEQGWALKSYIAGIFRFERCEPGEYCYQIDFADKFAHLSEDYREFMNDMGVEIVAQWGFWVFLRRRAAEGPFELYTDVESTIEHYRKIRIMFKIVTCLEILCLLFTTTNLFVISEDPLSTYNPLPNIFVTGVIFFLVLALIREIMRINSILAELGERLGKPVARNLRGRCSRFSPLVPLGMLLHCLALWPLSEVISGGLPLKGILQIAALVLMVTGLFRTARRP